MPSMDCEFKGLRHTFMFHNREERTPFVEKIYDYQISDISGHLMFNGYYYVENEDLPKNQELHHLATELEPYMSSITDTGPFAGCGTTWHYKGIINNFYKIQITDRVKHENTDKISKVYLDSDDEEMSNVCFFPTDIQTIYFKVLEAVKDVSTE